MLRRNIEEIIYRIFSFYKYREQDFQKRFYNAKYLPKMKYHGRNLQLHGKLEIVFPKGLSIGDDVQIGKDAFFDCRGGVIIGNNTFIERNVKILSTHHDKSSEPSQNKEKLIPEDVVIGEAVKIGTDVTILPGVQIGDRAVIRSGMLVKEDVMKDQIVPGNTANFPQQGSGKKATAFLNTEDDFGNHKISPMTKQSIGEGSQIVFVLSTGRSGSQSIASLANKHSKVDAYHEPFYNHLKVISTNYSRGILTSQKAKDKLIRLYSSLRLSKKGNVYLESDQKLVPLLGILKEIFPEAKYIWLIRNPSDFLKSARARGWFDGDSPAFNDQTVLLQQQYYSHGCRITGDVLSEGAISGWDQFSVEDKILWYWRYWNEEIERTLTTVPAERKHLIKLKDLNRNQSEFFNFLNLEGPADSKPVMANKVKERHKSQYKKLDRTENLKRQEKYFETVDQSDSAG